MNPGKYWFAMTQRQQQTGWATPREVAQDVSYNPYSDSHALAARVAPDPITFVGLPPENYKESFLSNVIEVVAQDPWNMAKVKVGKDGLSWQPDYWMTTPEGQNAEPFPIAPQIYHAFYVSSDKGMTWKLYATHKSSLAGSYTFASNFNTNDYANTNTLNQAMGNFPDDVTITASKVFVKPPPPRPTSVSAPVKKTPKPDNTLTYGLVAVNVMLLVFLIYWCWKKTNQ